MITDYETYVSVTGDTFTDQAKVLTNLVRAQGKIEELTGRQFEAMERTESLPVIDGQVWPSAYPITAVSAGGTLRGDGLAVLVTATGNAWLDQFAPAPDPAPRTYVSVTYTGGFAPDSAPSRLTDAICELAQRYSTPANTAAVPAGVMNVGINGQSYSGKRLGGPASIPQALLNEIHAFDHIASRMAD